MSLTIKSIKSLAPLLDRVLVQRAKAVEKTASGLFLPSTSNQTAPPEATVIAVGPGAPGHDGKIVPVSVQAGDRVLLPSFGGLGVKVGEEGLQLLQPIWADAAFEMSYLDPLPADLAQVLDISTSANALAMETAQSIIDRLEKARSQLTSRQIPEGLLPLSTFVKTGNQKVASAQKEWSSAVAKLSKAVDKKFATPLQPLFPSPAASSPTPPNVHSILPNNKRSTGETTNGMSSTQSFNSTSAQSLMSSNLVKSSLDFVSEPSLPFSSPLARSALNESIAIHLAHIGAFESLSTFLEESGTHSPISTNDLNELKRLHGILDKLRNGDCQLALDWLSTVKSDLNPSTQTKEGEVELGSDESVSMSSAPSEFTQPPELRRKRRRKEEIDPEGDLEFELRKEEFIRLLLKGTDLSGATEPLLMNTEGNETDGAHTSSSELKNPASCGSPSQTEHIQSALRYGGIHFRRILTPTRANLIGSLLTAPLYMPFSKLLTSPYGHIFSDYWIASSTHVGKPGTGGDSSLLPISISSHSSQQSRKLEKMFTKEYLQSLGLKVHSPLSLVCDIGGGGAMARIQKGRTVMKAKKTEWSAVGELPVEIPLPSSHRYHSIFACPVSKEQSTALNPPMLLPCGHVIAKESLVKLARGTPTLKCPYCPVVSHMNAAVRVYF